MNNSSAKIGLTMRYQISLFTIVVFLFCFQFAPLQSQPPDNARIGAAPQEAYDASRVYRQVTTHPDIDSYPAISPDGQWLAFASRRSGNMDIWVKPIQGGSATRITSHRTDEIMPAWSPDGEKLAYVSYQDDAAGDIWIVSLRKRGDELSVRGNPTKLTDYLGLDISPAFSPDGKFIAFVSDRDGTKNVYLLQLSNNRIFQITTTGAISPTWSPDGNQIAFVAVGENQSLFGQIFSASISIQTRIPQVTNIVQLTHSQSKDAFPSWNPLKNEIVFNRYNRDSNRDGLITPDDQPTLWKIIIEPDSTIKATNEPGDSGKSDSQQYHHEFELMPSFTFDYFPVCGSDGRVYFISQRSGNEDVWSIPTEGIIPKMEDAFLQYEFASNYFPIDYTDLVFQQSADTIFSFELEQRLLAFSRVNDFFPAEFHWIGWSIYEIARTYKALGKRDLAKVYFEEVIAQFQSLPHLAGEAELQLFELEFELSPEKLTDQLQQLNRVINRFQVVPQVKVHAQLLLGEIYYLHGRYSQALQALEQLIRDYPDQREKCALAQFLIGEIYKRFGQTEEVMNAFLKVVQNYPDQEAWVDSSLARILDLEGSEDVTTRLSTYRNIIARYGQYPRLAARAQLKIGETFYQYSNDFEAAESELPLVFMSYPDQRIEVARAKLLLAKIYFQKGDESRAIAEYKKVIDEFGDVQGGLFVVQAKEELLSIYIESGKRFRMGADVNAAYARYRDAVKMLPRDIEANRGMIASMYSLGLIDNAIRMYQNLNERYPNDEIFLYMLGLCYSYKATEQSDRTRNIENFDPILMKKSISMIRAALSKNYRLIQAYLTLSYNYEFMENYESAMRARERSFFSSAMQTLVAPVRTLVNWITFQKEKAPGQWYEQAIDALTAAISLNDERQNPLLESEIALNLANNFYNLREFGFERAYHYYQLRLQYDTTFVSQSIAAKIYRQMGHCAIVVEDFENGPKYLKKAAKLYQDLGDEENWLLNIKRLALIYQLKGESDNYDISNEYFLQATRSDEERKRYNQLLSGYRNIAYNYQLLNDEEEALRYANKAQDLIREEKVTRIKAKPNWIKIGILGIEFPIWDLGQIGAGFSTAAGGFTTDEETALLYTIMGQAKYGQKSIPGAISYIEKKIEIYRKRKDKIAEAIFLNNIGYLYYLDIDYKNAWDYFERSFKICKAQKNVPGMLINILNLSQVGAGVNRLQLLPATFVPDSGLTNLVTDAAQFLSSSLEYARSGLSLYDSEVFGYQKEKTQLYFILGDLHFLDKLYIADSLRSNYFYAARQTVERFESLAIADSCYRSALKIAIANNYKDDQVIANQKLGQVSLALGDLNNAIVEFNRARDLAIERNLLSQLWQINFALGKIHTTYQDSVKDRRDRKDANFYFNESINTIEQMIFEPSEAQNSPLHRFQVRMLYQDVIDFSIANNRMINALRLSEQFRGKTYLDFISTHRLELKKELHKIFYGNAKQSIKDINEKSAEVLSEKEKDQPSQQRIIELLQQKRQLIRDYRSLIENVKKEDPELESFVSVEPVTYVQLQKILDQNDIVLNYFISDKKTYLWAMSTDSIRFVTLSAPGDSIAFYTDQLLGTIITNQDYESSMQWLRENLFQPISEDIDRAKKIVIIPDGAMYRLPFSFLINNGIADGNFTKKIITASSLSDYFFSYQKRQIRGSKLLWVGSDSRERIEDAGFAIEKIDGKAEITKSAFKLQMQNTDIIYLNAKSEPKESDPLLSEIIPTLPGNAPRFRLREIYTIDLVSSLLIVDGISATSVATRFALERALSYAGAPSIIISLWDNPEPKFWDYFFEALIDYPVAEAFLLAQSAMQKAGYPPAFYAGYQLLGFEGMNEDQERQFAQERFESRVRMAISYYNENKWGDALKHFEQALLMAKKQGDTESIDALYNYIIKTAAYGGFFDAAIAYQLDLNDIAEANRDVSGIANGYNNLVHFYTEKKDFDRAVFYQNEYLKLAEQYDLRVEMASSYRNIGLVYERGGQYENSVAYFSKAIESFAEIGDSVNLALCLKDRGRVNLLHLDNYSYAISDQERALKILRSQNDLNGLLEILQNLGLSHEQLANYQEALGYQIQAFDIAKQLNNSYWIALSQHYLANLSWKMGNYEQALRYQKQAQQTFEKLNDVKLQSVGLATQGLIFMSLGNFNEALKYEKQALALAQTIDAKQDMATIHTNIGLIYRAQKMLNNAQAEFEQAIQIFESIQNKRGLGYGYRDLGSIFLQKGNAKPALHYFHRAMQISREIFDGRNETQCLYEIGKTYLTQGAMEAALDTLTIAAEKAKALFIPEVEWRCYYQIGQLHLNNNKLEQSIEAYHQALAVIEAMRAQIKVEEFKSGFIDDKLDVYFELVDMYFKVDQVDKALEIVERAKSRNFIDLLANRDIKFSGKVGEEKLAEGNHLQDEIRRVQNEMSGIVIKGDNISVTEKEKLANLTKNLEHLKEQYQKFLVELKEQNAELAEMVSVEPPQVDSLMTILPANVAVIEYFYSKDALFTWVISNQRVVARRKDFSDSELIALVDQLRKAIAKQMSILLISQQLHNLLIAPIEAELAPFEHVVIIPYGILHYLPFAALLDRNQNYLIEKQSISLAPSATVLDICMKKGAAHLHQHIHTAEILALGNPDLDKPGYELPFAEKEIESVQLLYPNVISFLNRAATETVFKKKSNTPAMILLSCHGEFDAVNPLFSSLLLAPDETNDGRLEAHEIFGLDMNAYLVVMSACETGLAKVSVGDELIGLTRSFIYAGSSSLISSLWKVDDLATAVMIKRFFRYLKMGDSRSRALQKAMIFVKDQINTHPAFWTAFNLIGDFR